MKPKLVCIRWIDHSNQGTDWIKADELDPLSVCISIGFIEAEDKNYLSLAQTVANHGDLCNIMHILKVAILTKKVIKLPSNVN